MADLKAMEAALLDAHSRNDLAAVDALSVAIQEQRGLFLPQRGQAVVGEQAVRGAVQEEARSRPWYERVAAGIGTAPALAGEAVRQLGQGYNDIRTAAQTAAQGTGVGSILDKFDTFLATLNPGLPRAANATAAIPTNPMVKPEQEALRDTDWYTKGGNIAGNVAMSYLLPARTLGWTSRLGMTADTGVTMGGLSAITTPGDTSDRMRAGVLSAGAAMAAPAVAGVLGMGGPLHRATTQGGRRTAVGEALRTELGGQADDVAAGLRIPSATGAVLRTQPSASMVTGNPTLEVLENASRVKRPDLWRNFDQMNGKQRWDALLASAGTPEELAMLKAARDSLTSPMRDRALDSASYSVRKGLGDVQQTMQPMRDKLVDLMEGRTRPNPDVQVLANYVSKQLDRVTTPGQLYEIRKVLTDGIKSGPTSELSQAARSARPQRMEIIGIIDDALDDLSNGAWGRYMTAYKEASKEVSSKEAMQKIADSLGRGQPLGAVPTAVGESAAWKTMGNLRDRFGMQVYGSKALDKLTPEDRRVIESLVTELKSQSNAMSAKGVLGSPTAQFLANAGRGDAVTRRIVEGGVERMLPVPGGGFMASKMFDLLGRKSEEEMAALMQNPQLLAEALQKAAIAQGIMRGSQKAGVAAGMNVGRD